MFYGLSKIIEGKTFEWLQCIVIFETGIAPHIHLTIHDRIMCPCPSSCCPSLEENSFSSCSFSLRWICISLSLWLLPTFSPAKHIHIHRLSIYNEFRHRRTIVQLYFWKHSKLSPLSSCVQLSQSIHKNESNTYNKWISLRSYRLHCIFCWLCVSV